MTPNEKPTAWGIEDEVHTIKGAKFRGRVKALYEVEPGNWRADVYAEHPWFEGTLHVYPTSQLAVASEPLDSETGRASMEAIEAAHGAMFSTPFDGSTAPMVGAGIDAALPIMRPFLDSLLAAQAYQVLGQLLHRSDLFDTPEGQRALDYFADGEYDPNFLPWPEPSSGLPPPRSCSCVDVEIQAYRSQGLVKIPEHMQALREHRRASGNPMWEWLSIDGCLIAEIRDLWDAGVRTTGCCCGHNVADPFIGVEFDDIEKMKALGYQVAPNPSRPGDEDSFYPKSIRRYDH